MIELQILARPLCLIRVGRSWGQSATPHLCKLRARLHVLRPQRRLDPVEETLEPADELGLCDPDLRLARRPLERDRQRSEERRVGKECRSRWAADHEKRKRASSNA